MRSIAARAAPKMRAAVRAHFDRELSFDSLGREARGHVRGCARAQARDCGFDAAVTEENERDPDVLRRMQPCRVVSIILPTFNRLEFLGPRSNRYSRRPFVDWELIIADDGSSADTQSVSANTR